MPPPGDGGQRELTQCQSQISLSEFCGTYHQRCASNSHYGGYDYTELVTYGPAHHDEDGKLVRNHTIFVTGGECLQPLASIIEVGEYEVKSPSTATKVCR